MRYPIWKERIHLLSPCANVCAVATLTRPADGQALAAAARDAVRAYGTLRSRVVIRQDGSAYLEEPESETPVSVQEFSGDVNQLMAEQERVPFRIEEGELIRFFFQPLDHGTLLAVMVHHVVCDGGSLMLLMGELLRALNGEPIPRRPVRLYTMADVPKHSALKPGMRLMLRGVNHRWNGNGAQFTCSDARSMQQAYTAAHPTELHTERFAPSQLARLRHICREWGVTLNSLISAAILYTLPQGESVGIAVDIRPADCDSLGNFATGVSVARDTAPGVSFPDYALRVHTRIRKTLDSPRQKYFLCNFMASLAPTLVDSIYFSRYGGYENALSASICRMCGYTEQTAGISLSNLTTIRMPEPPAGGYGYGELYFVPPYIPNVRSVIGLSTFRDCMTMTLHTASENAAEELTRFEKVCRSLRSLAADPNP